MNSNDESREDFCKSCHSGRVFAVQLTDAYTDDNGVSVTYQNEFSRCDACGEEFYTPEQSAERSRAITRALRARKGLLTGPEIRDVRSKLRMSLPKFEKAIGVGPKTVGKWERETVEPTSAANIGLWLAKHHQKIFLEYALTQGVTSDAPNPVLASEHSQTAPSSPTVNLALESGGRVITRTIKYTTDDGVATLSRDAELMG
jgi:putative zinc finger/helix-turn-helix YgiT family protein